MIFRSLPSEVRLNNLLVLLNLVHHSLCHDNAFIQHGHKRIELTHKIHIVFDDNERVVPPQFKEGAPLSTPFPHLSTPQQVRQRGAAWDRIR